nr:Os02g0831900 [Ipomoea batatas]
MHDNLTRKAIFLSLFIAENCFKRERTAESRGLSGAILSSTIQGWPGNQSKRIGGDSHKTSWAVNLLFGFRSSILRIKSLALSEIPGHGSDSKSSFPCNIWRKIPTSVSGVEEQQQQQQRSHPHRCPLSSPHLGAQINGALSESLSTHPHSPPCRTASSWGCSCRHRGCPRHSPCIDRLYQTALARVSCPWCTSPEGSGSCKGGPMWIWWGLTPMISVMKKGVSRLDLEGPVRKPSLILQSINQQNLSLLCSIFFLDVLKNQDISLPIFSPAFLSVKDGVSV